MADSSKLAPFIREAEGGYSNVSGDEGGETMKGVTYAVWKSYFGDTHDRFMKMSDDDWNVIFKGEYWDKFLGDKIQSQVIANTIGDWVFNSGKYFPEKDIQELINQIFGKHLATDGDFGQQTIDAINSVDQNEEYRDIMSRREQFYNDIVAKNPSQTKFLTGWKNRLINLSKYNIQFN